MLDPNVNKLLEYLLQKDPEFHALLITYDRVIKVNGLEQMEEVGAKYFVKLFLIPFSIVPFAKDSITPKVLASGMYVINVEPIPHHLRNNRKVHLDYLKHLKESVATLCEIVEEAKVERPLDRLVASACLYTKHSQELLEYVIGTCPKDFNKRDKKQATTSLKRKKQVTFADQCETSNTNTKKHVEQQITQKTNVLVLPSTGVDSCTNASGLKPRRNTKKSRISPAKSVNKKTVEDHSKTNKSHLQKPNRFDSSISSKCTVIVSLWITYNNGRSSDLANFLERERV
nr:hypothetical protein [Tanacetum cinerariifolium]